MNIKDLIALYEQQKEKVGDKAYCYISQILRDAKERHRKDFKGVDHEQSWKSFKGKNLEKLIEYIIKDEVKKMGLDIVNGNLLERTNCENLPELLDTIKRNLLIDYAEFGMHLPDADIVIFNPKSAKVVAILSSKATLRERIAQTGYWKLKLASCKKTKHIKVYFITLDEDGTLNVKQPAKKGRAIVEKDLDGTYVLSEAALKESDKVKMFDKFTRDLRGLLESEIPVPPP